VAGTREEYGQAAVGPSGTGRTVPLMADAPRDQGTQKPPPEVLRELTPTGRRRFVFAGWEETPGGYRSLIELSTEAADDPAGLARAFLEALRASDVFNGEEQAEPTGWRLVRGSHGVDYVRDPEGHDTPPAGFREQEPTPLRRLRSVPDEPAAADPDVRDRAIADIRARLGRRDGGPSGSAA
jgi:hypothetical protein